MRTRGETGYYGDPALSSICDGTYRFMDGTVKRRVLLLQLLEMMISRAAVTSGDADCVEFLFRVRHPHGPPLPMRQGEAGIRIHWLVEHGVVGRCRLTLSTPR
jgi:hypothetical protein